MDSSATATVGKASELSKEGQCNKLINSASTWAAAATLIPVNGVDMAALAAVEANLIINISSVYGEKLPKYAVSGVISTLLGTLVPMYGAQLTVPFLLKWVPFGNLVGAATMAGFGAAATYAIGKVFVKHYEEGGTFETFNASEASGQLKSEFASKINS